MIDCFLLKFAFIILKGPAAASPVQEESGGSETERGVCEAAEGAQRVCPGGEGEAANQTQVRRQYMKQGASREVAITVRFNVTRYARVNVSQIQWIYFTCPSGKDPI